MGHLSNSTRLADLLYGHPGPYLQRLKRPYDPARATTSCVCVGELKCGCWIVLDGNNRTGLLLAAHPDATLGDYPKEALLLYPRGTWDTDTMEWWNPAPRTFGEVMTSQRRRPRGRRSEKQMMFYGLAERVGDGSYYGVITSAADVKVQAQARTRGELQNRLRRALRRCLKILPQATVEVKLTGLDEESHVCRRNSSVQRRKQKFRRNRMSTVTR
jgi:hypothetical protein